MNIQPTLVFDFDRTLFATEETDRLYDDVEPVLLELRARRYHQLLLTAADVEHGIGFQARKVEESGIQRFIEPKNIIIVSMCELKLNELVDIKQRMADLRPSQRDDTHLDRVIGDRIDGEIYFGRQLGFTTVRIRRPGQKYSSWEPRGESQTPAHTISDLWGLLPLCPDLRKI